MAEVETKAEAESNKLILVGNGQRFVWALIDLVLLRKFFSEVKSATFLPT